jgi:hypothetical protein
MATLTDAEKAQLLTDARRAHEMVRNIENLMYAPAAGKPSRPGYKDAETGVTFDSTPLSPNVVLTQLAARARLTPAATTPVTPADTAPATPSGTAPATTSAAAA